MKLEMVLFFIFLHFLISIPIGLIYFQKREAILDYKRGIFLGDIIICMLCLPITIIVLTWLLIRTIFRIKISNKIL